LGPMLSVRFHDPEGLEGEINCLDPTYRPSTMRPEDEIVDPNWFERTTRALRPDPPSQRSKP
ncbi:MAG: VOC family protein, partial [Candidatus Binatia bacterium]